MSRRRGWCFRRNEPGFAGQWVATGSLWSHDQTQELVSDVLEALIEEFGPLTDDIELGTLVAW
jgi:hypothetical protein